jgi:hypothetical protein
MPYKKIDLLYGSKEVGREVNPEEPKYMLMSCYQKAGQKHSIQVANSSKFKYLGTSLTDQYFMYENINCKSRLNSGKACYHSV